MIEIQEGEACVIVRLDRDNRFVGFGENLNGCCQRALRRRCFTTRYYSVWKIGKFSQRFDRWRIEHMLVAQGQRQGKRGEIGNVARVPPRNRRAQRLMHASDIKLTNRFGNSVSLGVLVVVACCRFARVITTFP